MSDIDPSSIELSFSTPSGLQSITFSELDAWRYTIGQASIIQGVKIGGSIMAMITLVLVLKQRKKPLFILNQLSLFFIILRSCLYMYYLLGPSGSVTYQFSGWDILTQKDRNITVVTNAVQVVIILLIEANMLVQLGATFLHTSRAFVKYPILVFSTVLATVTVAFYILSLVYFSKITYGTGSSRNSSWQLNAPLILFLSSVTFTSFILLCKFFVAIRARRHLGIKQFSAYHSIFIMTFQTLVIPAAINIASYNLANAKSMAIPELAVFLTAIFLPLSSMWACATNTSPKPYSDAGLRFSDVSSFDTKVSTTIWKDQVGFTKTSSGWNSDLENTPDNASQNYLAITTHKVVK